MKQVGVFVDVSNQFHSVSTNYRGGKVNYERYLKAALRDDDLYRAFAYGVQLDDEARDFIIALREHGYEPKYKKAKKVDGRPNIRFTDWNVGIAMDVIRVLNRLDVVVIGSNDSDLIPLVQFCRERGKRVIIFSCKVGPDLKEAADEVIEIRAEIIDRKIHADPKGT